jgi:dihydroxyacetone kinase
MLTKLKVHYAETRTALTSGLKRLIKAEPDITNYDTIVGDGDCGIGLKKGADGRQKCMLKPNRTHVANSDRSSASYARAREADR